MDNNFGSTFMKVLAYTAEQSIRLAKESPVLGEPIEKDGVTVIPVSKVSAGFAGGGADVCDDSKKKRKNPSGSGAGVKVTPTAFLVMDGHDVKVVRIEEKEKSSVSSIVKSAADIFKKIKSDKKDKKALKDKDKDQDKKEEKELPEE